MCEWVWWAFAVPAMIGMVLLGAYEVGLAVMGRRPDGTEVWDRDAEVH